MQKISATAWSISTIISSSSYAFFISLSLRELPDHNLNIYNPRLIFWERPKADSQMEMSCIIIKLLIFLRSAAFFQKPKYTLQEFVNSYTNARCILSIATRSAVASLAWTTTSVVSFRSTLVHKFFWETKGASQSAPWFRLIRESAILRAVSITESFQGTEPFAP